MFGLCFTHPYAAATRTSARILLQVCVVALGFGMNLHEVLKAGRSGFVYTAMGISFALLMGLALGRILQVRGNSSFLITAGTAICGGSAIAAIGPILHADDEEMSVSLGTIFILNSVALLIFPPIGGMLHLSQSQFGLWAALAIHDTSSVVGAAAKYGPQALVIGTTVKLARALWIVPLALATAAIKHSISEDSRRIGITQLVENSASVVHLVFLPRRNSQHLHSGDHSFLSFSLCVWPSRPHGHSVSHRHGHFARHAEGGGLAPAFARNNSLVVVGNHFALFHSRRNDCVVIRVAFRANLSDSQLQPKGCISEVRSDFPKLFLRRSMTAEVMALTPVRMAGRAPERIRSSAARADACPFPSHPLA